MKFGVDIINVQIEVRPTNVYVVRIGGSRYLKSSHDYTTNVAAPPMQYNSPIILYLP